MVEKVQGFVDFVYDVINVVILFQVMKYLRYFEYVLGFDYVSLY